jgi:predicted acylesterase/phospholipase RssA
MAAQAVQSAAESDWTASRIVERLRNRHTLFVVALSGGGSRAAYFDAAVLERLSRITVPRNGGGDVSLVQRMDILSTVSGGSIAGAYFAAHRPRAEAASPGELAAFFARFKDAMAIDFERHLSADFFTPSRTLAFLTWRSFAESLGDALDAQLFGGRQLRYQELLAGARAGGPILIVNATMADFGLLTFTPDVQSGRPLYQVTQRPGSSGFSTETVAASAGRVIPSLVAFGGGYGNLEAFRVSDAVAASAAYPGLGTIRLGNRRLDEPRAILRDGGLVDNSGLLSLFAHVFNRRVFEAAEGYLDNIVVLAIDAGGPGGSSMGPLGAVAGIYDQAQQNLQRFVLPEMIRRAADQDLADLLARPGWSGFEFPSPLVFSYDRCRSKDVPAVGTRLRLTSAQRKALDEAADKCVPLTDPSFVRQVRGVAPARVRLYRGIFGPWDEQAWRTLFRLATAERSWRLKHGQFATISEVQRGVMATNHPREGRYDAKLEFPHKLTADATGFIFTAEAEGDRIRLSATPARYQDTGWVSLTLTVTATPRRAPEPEAALPPNMTQAEALQRLGQAIERMNLQARNEMLDDVRFCTSLPSLFRGGDLNGRPASAADPEFKPYGFDPMRNCF